MQQESLTAVWYFYYSNMDLMLLNACDLEYSYFIIFNF